MTRTEELSYIAQEWEEEGKDVDVMYADEDKQVILEIHSEGVFHWNDEANDELSEGRGYGAYEEAMWNE